MCTFTSTCTKTKDSISGSYNLQIAVRIEDSHTVIPKVSVLDSNNQIIRFRVDPCMRKRRGRGCKVNSRFPAPDGLRWVQYRSMRILPSRSRVEVLRTQLAFPIGEAPNLEKLGLWMHNNRDELYGEEWEDAFVEASPIQVQDTTCMGIRETTTCTLFQYNNSVCPLFVGSTKLPRGTHPCLGQELQPQLIVDNAICPIIKGGNTPDVIVGGEGEQVISGRSGDDIICGNAGDDQLAGGRGNDVILGGGGSDDITGGRGDDDLKGNGGNDQIEGGPGTDVLRGGNGNDILRGNGGNDTISGNGGDDELDGGPGHDTLNGGGGFDECANGESNNSCEIAF